jgi:uncharacterized protein
MNITTLSDDELDYLDEVFATFGNEQSVVDVCELDGFFTALAVSPKPVELEQWYPALWGGDKLVPELDSEDEAEQLLELLTSLHTGIVQQLAQEPEEFTALFGEGEFNGEEVTVVEEWCHGFMRGVALAGWPKLNNEQQKWLQAIALHGDEQSLAKLEAMSLDEHQDSVLHIEPAVRALYAAFHKK